MTSPSRKASRGASFLGRYGAPGVGANWKRRKTAMGEMMSDLDWQPMETAPKNGCPIRLKLRRRETVACWITRHNGQKGSKKTAIRNAVIAANGGYWGGRKHMVSGKPLGWKPLYREVKG